MKPKTSELNPKRLWKVIDLTIQTLPCWQIYPD